MAPSDSFESPSVPRLFVSLAVGVMVGLGIVLPAFRDDLTWATPGAPGPIAAVLLVGVLGLVVVTLGLFALYQLFWLVDR